MRIAILGWGSLIWNLDGLHTVEGFRKGGPTLAIEFCRVSQNGRLTLVIDQAHGAPCVTYHAQSTCTELDQAIEDLRIRECTTTDQIGFVDLATGEVNPTAKKRHQRAVEAIAGWAANNSYNAVIWTALGIKFKDAINVAFSVDAAVRYLEGLDVEKLETALAYIRKAPDEVQTPVRIAVDERWPNG